MTPADLAALHHACFTTPRPWSEAEFADLLAAQGVFLITQPNGFILGRDIAQEIELLTLAVDPKHRRKGIANQLLKDFLAKSNKLKANDIFLEVAADNTAAKALYAQHGYVQVGERPNYYAPNLNALILRKSLLESP